MTAANPSIAVAVGVLRLALAECEAGAAEIRTAVAAPENANYLVGTASVVETSLAHALDLVRAARTVLLPARAGLPPRGPHAPGGRP